MRNPVPENKIIYVRFHATAMQVIEYERRITNKKKATIVREILYVYMKKLYSKCHNYIENIEEKDLALSPLSSAFFIQRGRSLKSVVGAPMRITINRVIDRDMTIIANQHHMSTQDFRTAIIITYGIDKNILT